MNVQKENIPQQKKGLDKPARRGFTLIEVAMAVSLSAVILASLTIFYRLGVRSFIENAQRDELVQHGRMAMYRIINDIRYGSEGMQFDSSPPMLNPVCYFKTRNLENKDFSTVEELKYWMNKSAGDTFLLREVIGVGGTAPVIAGTEVSGDVLVTSFKVSAFDVDVADNLNASGVFPSNAHGVIIELTLQDPRGNTFTVSSSARMRNKF